MNAFFTGYEWANLNSNQTRPCLNLTDWDCLYETFYQVDIVKCASEYCPLECETIQYDLTVSNLIHSTLQEFNALNNSLISYEEWRTQQLEIFVYYIGLEYTLIEEIPAMSVINLIANLGGTMGLIVSVSFFSIVELAELVVLLLTSLFRNQKISNKASSI